MPIHDQSYRHYGGGRAAPGRSWTVIAWAGMRTFFKKRSFMGLMLFALAPFIVRAVQMWISSQYPQASMLAPTAETFRQFLEQQDFFVFVITVYVGAGLIANDRRANALQIYLSKPLMRSEYIAGKLAVLFGFLLLVTFVPAMLLLFLKVIFDGNFTLSSRSSSAGTSVTSSRKPNSTASFPAMYSDRISGLERYICSALARRSFAISPAPT